MVDGEPQDVFRLAMIVTWRCSAYVAQQGLQVVLKAGPATQILLGAHPLSGYATGTSVEGDPQEGGGPDETSP